MPKKQRTQFDFGEELENMHLTDFDTSSEFPIPSVKEKKDVAAIAEASGFKSREPRPKKLQRRRRTGRNVQLNIKVTPEIMEAFYAIGDKQGWVLGEALEKAVTLLEKEYGET